MAYENFPDKKRGDSLSANHINNLNSVSRRAARMLGGGGSSRHMSYGSTGLNTFDPMLVKITEIEDEEEFQYKGKIRYYNFQDSEWADSTEEFQIDGKESAITLTEGSKVVCFYHSQRDRLIPIGATAIQTMKIGKTTTNIVAGGSGPVEIWRKPNTQSAPAKVTPTETIGAHNDWLHDNRELARDVEVILGYFADESIWRIIGEVC